MPVRIESQYPPLTRDQIAGLEAELGYVLPSEYRNFLFATNVGAVGSPARYGREPGAVGVSVLFGLCDNEDYDLRKQRESYEGRIPDGFLAVGSDGGGNLICLRISDGSVFFWDHEGEASGDAKPTMDNMRRIAATFAEFLKGIAEIPQQDLAVDPRDVKSVWVDPEFMESLKKPKR